MVKPRISASMAPGEGWLDFSSGGIGQVNWPFVLALTVIGGVLRFFHLANQSLWVDEMLTWSAIQPGGSLSFVQQFIDTIQGPLYLAATWPLLHLNDTPLMMRLPAAVVGTATIPLFGYLAFRTVSARAAQLALLLLAINPFHIWYSQEGRGYAFLMFFAVAVVISYLNILNLQDDRPAIKHFWWLGISGAALILSNMSGVFLLAALALSLVLFDRPKARQYGVWWVLGFGLAGVIAAPWLLKASGIWAIDRIVPGAGMGAALRGSTTFSPLAVPYGVFSFFFGYSLGPSLRELHQPDRLAVILDYWPLLIAGGAVVVTALVAGWEASRRQRPSWVFLISVPLLFVIVLAVRNIKPWNARYVSVALPWLLLLTGAGLARLPRKIGAVTAALLLGLTICSLAGYYGRDDYAKADIAQAVAAVAEAKPPAQVVLVPVVTSVFRYYDRGDHLLIDSFGQPPLRSRQEALAYVSQALKGHEFCRVVLARVWFFDPHGLLLPALSELGLVRRERQLPGVTIYTWERTTAAGGHRESERYHES